MRWIDQNGKRPFDEFVELITYDQTREYLKRVVGIFARYRFLYAGEVYQVPKAIDTAYLKD
jgi:soluble lytic murein transglycosylase-like protein